MRDPATPKDRWAGLDTRLRGWSARPRRLRDGLCVIAAYGVAYAACLLLLAIGGARPGTDPWLAIPDEVYFFWEAAFIAPVIVAAAVLGAATMHLCARAFGGRGDFDDTLALVGPVTAIASLTTLVPDSVIAVLLCVEIVDESAWMHAITQPSPTLAMIWIYLSMYLVAFAITYPAIARVVHGLRGWRAIVVGWASFAIYQVMLYVFVR